MEYFREDDVCIVVHPERKTFDNCHIFHLKCFQKMDVPQCPLCKAQVPGIAYWSLFELQNKGPFNFLPLKEISLHQAGTLVQSLFAHYCSFNVLPDFDVFFANFMELILVLHRDKDLSKAHLIAYAISGLPLRLIESKILVEFVRKLGKVNLRLLRKIFLYYNFAKSDDENLVIPLKAQTTYMLMRIVLSTRIVKCWTPQAVLSVTTRALGVFLAHGKFLYGTEVVQSMIDMKILDHIDFSRLPAAFNPLLKMVKTIMVHPADHQILNLLLPTLRSLPDRSKSFLTKIYNLQLGSELVVQYLEIFGNNQTQQLSAIYHQITNLAQDKLFLKWALNKELLPHLLFYEMKAKNCDSAFALARFLYKSGAQNVICNAFVYALEKGNKDLALRLFSLVDVESYFLCVEACTSLMLLKEASVLQLIASEHTAEMAAFGEIASGVLQTTQNFDVSCVKVLLRTPTAHMSMRAVLAFRICYGWMKLRARCCKSFYLRCSTPECDSGSSSDESFESDAQLPASIKMALRTLAQSSLLDVKLLVSKAEMYGLQALSQYISKRLLNKSLDDEISLQNFF